MAIGKNRIFLLLGPLYSTWQIIKIDVDVIPLFPFSYNMRYLVKYKKWALINPVYMYRILFESISQYINISNDSDSSIQ